MADVNNLIDICEGCIEKGTPIGTEAMTYSFYYELLEVLNEYKEIKGKEQKPCDNCQEFNCDFCPNKDYRK